MKTRPKPGERLRLAVEDRFLVIRLAEDDAMLPIEDVAYRLTRTLSSFLPDFTIIVDSRGVDTNTWDIVELTNVLKECAETNTLTVLDYRSKSDMVRHWFGDAVQFLPIRRGELPLRYEELNLVPFEDDFDIDYLLATGKYHQIVGNISASPPTETEWETLSEEDLDMRDRLPTFENYLDSFYPFTAPDGRRIGLFPGPNRLNGRFEEYVVRRRIIEQFINRLGRNSLLTHYALTLNASKLIMRQGSVV